jgi:DNA-binding XRE family transcriptional regulator
VILKQAREEACLTQEELASILKTKKPAVSRIENHPEYINKNTRPLTITDCVTTISPEQSA